MGRDFDNGKKMFSAGRCVACHRFEGTGGYSGPDLGSVAKRYSIQDILVAISEPSQSISEQYQASMVLLKGGGMLFGRIIYRNDQEIAVASNPFDFNVLTKAPIVDVASVKPSQVSMMPSATIALVNLVAAGSIRSSAALQRRIRRLPGWGGESLIRRLALGFPEERPTFRP